MFNSNLEAFDEEESFAEKLLLAVVPGLLMALVPAAVEIWKEVRAERRGDPEEPEELDESSKQE